MPRTYPTPRSAQLRNVAGCQILHAIASPGNVRMIPALPVRMPLYILSPHRFVSGRRNLWWRGIPVAGTAPKAGWGSGCFSPPAPPRWPGLGICPGEYGKISASFRMTRGRWQQMSAQRMALKLAIKPACQQTGRMGVCVNENHPGTPGRPDPGHEASCA